MNLCRNENVPKVALLWRGDPDAVIERPSPQNNRLYPLFNAFADLNVLAEPVVYSDEAVQNVYGRLLHFDGVLVWVDPITEGQDRSTLDSMLKDISAQGVWVSAHPDVILKIGTKEVLFRTRHLGWGTDARRYATYGEFREEFPARLRSGAPRVLKQRHGNGGIGTWRVEPADAAPEGSEAHTIVLVQEARRGSREESLPLNDFIQRCEGYFSKGGCLIDQPFQRRVAEGMIRCYLVHNRVVGFSTQEPRAEGNFAMARKKTMYEESEPRFRELRNKMESEWVPSMQQLLSIATESLPVLWDADFLYGPKTGQGEDTYVLCEINISAVLPFPERAALRIAHAALARMTTARQARRARDSARNT